MRLRFVFPPLLTGQYICDFELLYHAACLRGCTACELAFIAYMLLTVDAEPDINMALAAAVVSCWASVAMCKQIA